MPHRASSFDNFFMVRWGVPEVADCEEIKARIPALRERAGKPLVYIAVMPADLPKLEDDHRKILMDLTEAVLPACHKLIIVMEGTGFRAAILRSAMTAVMLLTRRHDTLRVVDSLDVALELTDPWLPTDRRAIARVMREIGNPVPESLGIAM